MIEPSLLRSLYLQIIFRGSSKDKTPAACHRYTLDVSWRVGDVAFLIVSLLCCQCFVLYLLKNEKPSTYLMFLGVS